MIPKRDNPGAYLCDALSVQPEWPARRVDELLLWNCHRNKRQYGSQLTFIIRVMIADKRSKIAIQPNLYEEIIQTVSIKKIGVDNPLKEIGVTRHLQVLFGSMGS